MYVFDIIFLFSHFSALLGRLTDNQHSDEVRAYSYNIKLNMEEIIAGNSLNSLKPIFHMIGIDLAKRSCGDSFQNRPRPKFWS